ncbi:MULTISPECIES: DUF3618 domain-containing protein [unclassified Knoellia]|uniref:DUF3618 domain-containing protein n=1 Tax=Knoellia altitudinis TaxID=3404795 RepID=UPI0036062319
MSDPDIIRQDIERTRSRLSNDVNDLTTTADPRNIARRQVNKVGSKAGSMRERVMGTADDASSKGADMAHQAADVASSAPQQLRSQTRGNPLAAGAVALAAGWLLGSLLPASQKEREGAQAVREQAQPLVDEATSMAKEAAAHLKEPAQEAAASVKETAQAGAQEVKAEGASAAQTVTEEGRAKAQEASP